LAFTCFAHTCHYHSIMVYSLVMLSVLLLCIQRHSNLLYIVLVHVLFILLLFTHICHVILILIFLDWSICCTDTCSYCISCFCNSPLLKCDKKLLDWNWYYVLKMYTFPLFLLHVHTECTSSWYFLVICSLWILYSCVWFSCLCWFCVVLFHLIFNTSVSQQKQSYYLVTPGMFCLSGAVLKLWFQGFPHQPMFMCVCEWQWWQWPVW
jgi:hypothetical protein